MASPSKKHFKKATELCRTYQATISFGYTGEGSEVDVDTRQIVIDLSEMKNEHQFWSEVFHEIAHLYCYDNGIYYIYHHDCLSDKEMAKYVRRFGLKIERYVDKMGERLAKELGFRFRYKPNYQSESDAKWYREWIERTYPL